MRDERQLRKALENGLSGVSLSPFAAHRMALAIAGEAEAPRRRFLPAWAVGLAVALITALWPLAAVSELVI